MLIFKVLILQALYTLSDEQAEYQTRDRLSVMRFLNLGLEDNVPDATTLWPYREALVATGRVEQVFAQVDAYLRAQGYRAVGGQIVDASTVEAPRQHKSAEANALIKAGGKPQDWSAAKARQKDTGALDAEERPHLFRLQGSRQCRPQA